MLYLRKVAVRIQYVLRSRIKKYVMPSDDRGISNKKIETGFHTFGLCPTIALGASLIRKEKLANYKQE